VAGETLGELDTTARTSKPVVWHHDKMVRKAEVLRKRKERKRQWMREMYAQGKGSADGGGGGGGGYEEEEEDIDALLEWSDALDYDAYHADWMSLATSSRPVDESSMGPIEPQPY